jgi:hypothetical protein
MTTPPAADARRAALDAAASDILPPADATASVPPPNADSAPRPRWDMNDVLGLKRLNQ